MKLATNIIHKCSLSYLQATTILRPFIFSVHPDFFVRHPVAQKINESSLKNLNSYLQNIELMGSDISSRRSILSSPPKNVVLQFYMRTGNNYGNLTMNDMQRIVLKLTSIDLETTVRAVLSAANLSLDELDDILSVEKQYKNEIKVKFHGPEEVAQQYEDLQTDHYYEPRTQVLLSDWLMQNVPLARKRMKSSKSAHKEYNRLCLNLKRDLKLAEIPSWQRGSVSLATKISDLSAARRAAQSNPEVWYHFSSPLTDYRLIFCRDSSAYSGINALGDALLLAAAQSPESWTSAITKLSWKQSILVDKRIPRIEAAISALLYKAKVIRLKSMHSTTPAPVYHRLLKNLLIKLADFHRHHSLSKTKQVPVDCLSGFHIALEPISSPSCDIGFVSTPFGSDALTVVEDVGSPLLFFSAETPPELLIGEEALARLVSGQLANEAESDSQNRYQINAEWVSLRNGCIRRFNMKNLRREYTLPLNEAASSCQRLIRVLPSDLNYTLTDMSVGLGHYYSVQPCGELLVPWDWKLCRDI